ncbi:MAG: translocation/assembly module TamB domain-containing protein [Pseudomonadota bacterium]
MTGVTRLLVLLWLSLFSGYTLGSQAEPAEQAVDSGYISEFLIKNLGGFLPETISYGGFTGSLTGRFEFRDVRFAQPPLVVELDRLIVDWSPSGLLFGSELIIENIQARGLRCRPLPEQITADTSQPADNDADFGFEFPLTVQLERLDLLGIDCVLSDDGQALPITQLHLRDALVQGAQLKMAEVSLSGDQLNLEGRLDVVLDEELPVTANLTWRYMPSALAPILGRLQLQGDADTLNVNAQVAAPYGVTLQGRVSGVLAEPDLNLKLSLDTPDVGRWAESDALQAWQGVQVDTSIDVAGKLDELDVRAAFAGRDVAGRSAVGELEAMFGGKVLALQSVRLAQPERGGLLEGKGELIFGDTTDTLAGQLDINWSALQWPLLGVPRIADIQGAMTAHGNLDAYEFDFALDLQPTQTAAVGVKLSGQGNQQQLAAKLRADIADGQLNGHLETVLKPHLRSSLELSGAGLDPGLWATEYAGNLDLKLTARAELGSAADAQALRVDVDELQMTGQLREKPLEFDVAGLFEQSTVDGETELSGLLQRLQFEHAGSSLNASGSLHGGDADLKWELDSPDLSALMPDWRGSLATAGQVSGRWPALQLEASLTARMLDLLGLQMETVDLSADLDLGGDKNSHLTLNIGPSNLAGNPLASGRLNLTGDAGQHKLALQADSDLGAISLQLAGSAEGLWQDQFNWQGQLQAAKLALFEMPSWELVQPVGMQFGLADYAVNRFCWQAQASRICGQTRGDYADIQASLEIENFDLAHLESVLTQRMDLSGQLVGGVEVATLPGSMAITSNLTSRAVRFSMQPNSPNQVAELREIAVDSGVIDTVVDDNQGRLQVGLDTSVGGLRIDLSVPELSQALGAASDWANLSVAATVQTDVPDLSFLNDLLPQVRGIAGRLQGDLTVQGTAQDPMFGGDLAIAEGAVEVPSLGLGYRAVNLGLRGQDELLSVAASARSVPLEDEEDSAGQIELTGTLGLVAGAALANVRVQGDNFLVSNDDQFLVFASPNLTVQADPRRIDVAGNLAIPRARIAPLPQPPSAITASSDQVLLEPAGVEQSVAAQRPVYAQLRLQLGEDVTFDGFGLKARLAGDVAATLEPETPIVATGELRIYDGEYRAYGQGLVIDSGRVFYAGGPISRPGLDIRAVRRPKEGILVGAQIGGDLQEPTFTLFSDPGMVQQEQLSYLVLGRGLNETSGGESSALARAALALGVKGGDSLAKRIGGALGVDEVAIRSGSGEAGAQSNPEDAALVVGKYLTPKLYVSYGIGLFDPESVLRLQYEISRRWQFLTESGTHSTGADVIYTIETGN